MNTVDLQALGLEEMNQVEMKGVEGGRIFSKVWNWMVGHSIQDATAGATFYF
ncbi:MAG: hypothetical protein H6Q14_2484 [Bacteroidetes bacterium]|nr:hypothetical protein [Bacteroidota bacterium]